MKNSSFAPREGRVDAQFLSSVLGIGSLLAIYSFYRVDSSLGLVTETDWLYLLPYAVGAMAFLFAFGLAVAGRLQGNLPWQTMDLCAAIIGVLSAVALYCCSPHSVEWLTLACRVLLRIVVCYFFVSWGSILFRESVRSTVLVLCGAFLVRAAFFLLCGLAGPQAMAPSVVFLPAVVAVSLGVMRENSLIGSRAAALPQEYCIAPFSGRDAALQRKAVVALCLMVGCCGYLLVFARTTWFGFQDAQGIIWLQFFQALSNAAIGLLFWVLYRRRWNPQSVSTFWAFPLVAVICALLYVLSNVDGRITLIGSFGVDFAGSILLAATILVPFFFSRERRLVAYCALNASRTLFQTLATAAFSLSAAVGLQTALSVLMLMLLLGSFVFYIPTMQKAATQWFRPWRDDVSADGGVAESEELLSIRSELDGLRDELQTMRFADAARSEEERWRELSRRFSLTRREEEVFLLLASGYTAKTIADRLVISVSTVKTHVGNVYAKIGVKSQQELLKWLEEAARESEEQ